MKRRTPMPLWSQGPTTQGRRLFYGAARLGGVTVITRPGEGPEPRSRHDSDPHTPSDFPGSPEESAPHLEEEEGPSS